MRGKAGNISCRMSALHHNHPANTGENINLDEAFTAVTEALQRVEKDTKVS